MKNETFFIISTSSVDSNVTLYYRYHCNSESFICFSRQFLDSCTFKDYKSALNVKDHLMSHLHYSKELCILKCVTTFHEVL